MVSNQLIFSCSLTNQPIRYLEDQTNLHKHAARNAQDAIKLARDRARAFDVETAQDRKTTTLTRDKKDDDHDEGSALESSDSPPNADTALIVDRSCFFFFVFIYLDIYVKMASFSKWIRTSLISKILHR